MRSAPRTLVNEALAGNESAARELVRLLSPVVQARVVRVLRRVRGEPARAWRAQVEDHVQEAFASLFRDGGKVLRAWNEERGLSLQNYVGMVVERRVIDSLRRRQPVDSHTTDVTLDELAEVKAPGELTESVVATREFLQALLDRLREELSPQGMHLFQLVFIDERSVEEVVSVTGMTAEAVYAWRSRLRSLVCKLASELNMSNQSAARRSSGGHGHGT